MSDKSAIEKSIERHGVKKALRDKQKAKRGGDKPALYGCGMGWPERKDFETEAEYIAYRRAQNPDYTPNHDGRLYAIV